jgi:predicted AAA+ superfamily ATPase
VCHFRTRRGAEVDFILSVGREHWAIEVKASRQVDARDLKGLGAFAEYARKDTRRIVVFLGERRQQLDEVEVLPLEDSLAELPG